MPVEAVVLEGEHVRLEPLEPRHAEALVAASAADPSLYQWSIVPVGRAAVDAYIATALAWRDAGTALPFATIRRSDNTVIGSTRFWLIEKWNWPASSPHFGKHVYDTCEIGYTWLTGSAIRTAANTEAKLLMLTHAFESWNVNSVSLCTDRRNERSAAAIQRIGAKLEGTLRAHRMASDFTPRNTLRFSVIASEWPEVKNALQHRLMQRR
ncbi:MAG TPA: GNAT family protein [Acidobacteriaceae bacterium]|jgi:RimJ/RimL family protein N-acetyltransferase|nr:GNAT family protein [Acidobacteriaceae bacterium]